MDGGGDDARDAAVVAETRGADAAQPLDEDCEVLYEPSRGGASASYQPNSPRASSSSSSRDVDGASSAPPGGDRGERDFWETFQDLHSTLVETTGTHAKGALHALAPHCLRPFARVTPELVQGAHPSIIASTPFHAERRARPTRLGRRPRRRARRADLRARRRRGGPSGPRDAANLDAEASSSRGRPRASSAPSRLETRLRFFPPQPLSASSTRISRRPAPPPSFDRDAPRTVPSI